MYDAKLKEERKRAEDQVVKALGKIIRDENFQIFGFFRVFASFSHSLTRLKNISNQGNYFIKFQKSEKVAKCVIALTVFIFVIQITYLKIVI